MTPAERTQKWREDNRERHRAYSRQYYHDHKEAVYPKTRDWIARNNGKSRKYKAAWKRRNLAASAAHRASRLARLKLAIHPEIDVAIVIEMYAEAGRLTAETGVKHVVDHIIPVSRGGWHHHDNLQVLPELVNLRKGADPFIAIPGFKSWADVPMSLWPEALANEYHTRLNTEKCA